MSDRVDFWVRIGLTVLLVLSLSAIIIGIIGQIVTTGHVSVW